MIEWIETTQSTNITAFGYDPESSTLSIKFKSGTTYNYMQVPDKVFEAMKTSASKGRFFQKNIKDLFQHQKI
jgi:hypothetical protein